MDRVKYLDGHRGLAILLVFFFHSFSRWQDIVPYGDKYSDFVLFEYGFLGVQLFFIISGFVILMSLERCKGILEFMKKRWVRLFPAMLICSILVYVSSPLFTYRPSGEPKLEYLLPGLTFIDLSIWKFLFNYPEKQLEGVYWSLYVEFKFYVFSSIIYFLKGRTALVASLVVAFFIACTTRFLSIYFDSDFFLQLDEVIKLLSFRHFGWFAIGAAYYIYIKESKKEWLYYAILISIFCSLLPPNMTVGSAIGAFGICFIFGLSVSNEIIKDFLTNRLFLFFGYISYPFYLIHENALISGIIQLKELFPFIPLILLPFLMLSILSLVAFFIVKYSEAYLIRSLRKIILK